MKEFNELIDIIKALRAPNGCPWDKEQTLYSLKKEMSEEMAELLDALDNKDIENIKEELGDVLLHVVFHSVVASEDNLFTIEDVCKGINEKLVRRHPHVFGDVKVSDTSEVKANWDKIKANENKDKSEPVSILDKVPRNLPSIMQAEKLQKKVAKVGFDWTDINQVFNKLHEELDELKEAYLENDSAHISEELGDVYFVLTRLSSHLKVDPDESIRFANNKFRKRFAFVEKELESKNISLEDASLDDMEAAWIKAKENGL